MSAVPGTKGRLDALRERELARFADERPHGVEELARARSKMPNGVPMAWMSELYTHPPIFVDAGHGGTFTDIDGNTYIDFNLADTSMFTGYGVEAISEVVAKRVKDGSQFLLPTQDAVEVATRLAARFGLPFWQFTLSATQANVEAIRTARALTGRDAVLMFDGKYHGHADELLAVRDKGEVVPEGRGVLRDATRHVRLVPYNDLDAVSRELARGDIACVVAEAAITNAGVILPAEGFHAGLRRLTSDAGTLLVIDETHTLVAGPGGLTARWGLQPDLLVVGKSVSGGISLGAYGMTERVAAVLDDPDAASGESVATGDTLFGNALSRVATGGTLFGNALSLAAARVTLEQVLTDQGYAHAAALGGKLADGIEATAAANGFDWRAHRLYNRSGYTHGPYLPSNAADARDSFDAELFNIQRIYMANRGIWEAIDSAGPAAGIQTTAEHVDHYLEVLNDFLGELRQ
jgi:glutamate-1-semialdehyde 2,1-aminomutase